VEQNSNLVTEAWETVDYAQISLELGDSVILSAPVSTVLSSSESTNQIDIPYEITPEYLEAVSNGEITNSAWTASSIWDSVQDEVKGFFRIQAISYVDSDGDGIDNVTEHALNLNPYEQDAPPVSLPEDDGDPRPVQGSVDSSPGDWNTPPLKCLSGTGKFL
jgi:hypothetical protein